MRNASTGPASQGVQLSRSEMKLRSTRWGDWRSLEGSSFSVCMSIIVRTTNRGLLSSAGVLALQKSLILFSLWALQQTPADELTFDYNYTYIDHVSISIHHHLIPIEPC